MAEVFIGAKVLILGGRIGFVFSHDGTNLLDSPWRVAFRNDEGVYTDYMFVDTYRLRVLGDFGECFDENHPIKEVHKNYYAHFSQKSFVDTYNLSCGKYHADLHGDDNLCDVEVDCGC